MVIEDQEFTKALFVGTRFGNEKLNQLGYRRFWHHPTIITEKGIQTPDGLLHNNTFYNTLITEYKGHRTVTNLTNRIKEDKMRIERYGSIKTDSLKKSLDFKSETQDMIWFWDKNWKDMGGKDYFKGIEPHLNQYDVREWEVVMTKKKQIKFKHIGKTHNDKNLNSVEFFIDQHKRDKCSVISRNTPISEYLDAIYFALLAFASKGEPSFSLDNIFDLLESNYYLCERKNDEFRRRMRTTINEFASKKGFTGVLNPTESRKTEIWSFQFQVELGRDERRIRRIEETYEKIKSKWSGALY
jgi:hypothetical protein